MKRVKLNGLGLDQFPKYRGLIADVVRRRRNGIVIIRFDGRKSTLEFHQDLLEAADPTEQSEPERREPEPEWPHLIYDYTYGSFRRITNLPDTNETFELWLRSAD